MANERRSAGGEGLGLPLTMPSVQVPSLHIPGLGGGLSGLSHSRPVLPTTSGVIADHHHHQRATGNHHHQRVAKLQLQQQQQPNHVAAKPKRTGFSLPLTSSNHSSVLPISSSIQSTVPSSIHVAHPSAALSLSSTDANAQSKRCRFALKESSKNATNATGFNTSTSSNASTVIEQPIVNDYKIAESKISTVMPQASKAEGLAFKPPLMIEQAEELMLQAKAGKSPFQVHARLPKRPKGGTMFLIETQRFFESKSDTTTTAKTLSQDGYMWTEILHQSDLITAKDNHLDYRHYYISTSLGDGRRTRTSSKFRREAYTMGDLTLVTYIGDEREAMISSQHPKDPRAPQPPASLQATTFNSLPRSHRYDKRPRGHEDVRRAHSSSNLRPRSLERKSNDILEHEMQLKKLQAMNSEGNQLSIHMGPSTIQGELIALSEELAAGKLVKNLTLFPSLQITLVHPDMTREFEHACQVLYSDPLLYIGPSTITQPQDGIRLFYDITFPIGRLHVTLLTFVNACYEGHPIMPLAVNIHERQFKSSHSLFWARVVGDIPALHKHRFPLMIDDAEPAVHLAVRAQAPNLVQLEGWPHRFRDIDRYLRTKGYGEEAINYFKACVCYLLNSPSKQAMHDRFRKEFEYVWPKDFVLYYRQRLLPRSGRLGRWAMAKLNICESQFLSPHTNPQERFHRLCNYFHHWGSLSLEQLIRAFNYLFIFFVNELSLRDSGNGAFVLKTAYQPQFHGFNHPRWQNVARVPHPTEIATLVSRQHPALSSAFFRPASTGPGHAGQHAGQLGQGQPRVMAAAITDHTTAAFSGESFDDVKEMEEALDKMFRESEDEEFLLNLPDDINLFKPVVGSLGKQRERQTRFKMSHGQTHSSSFSSNVPSPAPNGQVPSPAPEDQNKSVAPDSAGIGGGSNTTTTTKLGAPVSRNSKPGLSTIPEVSTQRELNNNQNQNNIQNTTTATNQLKPTTQYQPVSQPPDLLVHSGNWQEHSFDSSVVTEGHYDASFESEVPPMGLSMEKDNNGITGGIGIIGNNTTCSNSITTAGTNNTILPPKVRPPKIAQTAKKSVFSMSGLTTSEQALVTTTGPSSVTNSTTKPNSLMLWKKVQHYVVVGGALVGELSSAAEAATSTTTTTNVQQSRDNGGQQQLTIA